MPIDWSSSLTASQPLGSAASFDDWPTAVSLPVWLARMGAESTAFETPWHVPAGLVEDSEKILVRPPLDLSQIDVPLSGPQGAMKEPSER